MVLTVPTRQGGVASWFQTWKTVTLSRLARLIVVEGSTELPRISRAEDSGVFDARDFPDDPTQTSQEAQKVSLKSDGEEEGPRWDKRTSALNLGKNSAARAFIGVARISSSQKEERRRSASYSAVTAGDSPVREHAVALSFHEAESADIIRSETGAADAAASDESDAAVGGSPPSGRRRQRSRTHLSDDRLDNQGKSVTPQRGIFGGDDDPASFIEVVSELPPDVLATVVAHMETEDLWPDAGKLLQLQRRQKWFKGSSTNRSGLQASSVPTYVSPTPLPTEESDITEDAGVSRSRAFSDPPEPEDSKTEEYRIILLLGSSARSANKKNQEISVAHTTSAVAAARDLVYLCKTLDDELTEVGSANISEHHLLSFFERLARDKKGCASDDPVHNKRSSLRDSIDSTTSLVSSVSQAVQSVASAVISGAKPDSSGDHPLLAIMASAAIFAGQGMLDARGFSAALNRCVARGLSLNVQDSRGRCFLHFVCMGASEQVLLDPRSQRGAKSIAGREQALLELVKLLIKHQADLNIRDSDGWTPLHCACDATLLNVVLLLVRSGANVLALTEDGSTPLNYLVKHDLLSPLGTEAAREMDMLNKKSKALHAPTRMQVECIRLMLDRGALVDGVNRGGETLLHRVAASGSLPVAAYLLDRGARVDARSHTLDTPLHYAARRGRLLMATFLVERGASGAMEDAQGKTASQIAADRGFKELSNLLIHIRERESTLWSEVAPGSGFARRQLKQESSPQGSRLTITALMTGSFYDSDDEDDHDEITILGLPSDDEGGEVERTVRAIADDAKAVDSIIKEHGITTPAAPVRGSSLFSAVPPEASSEGITIVRSALKENSTASGDAVDANEMAMSSSDEEEEFPSLDDDDNAGTGSRSRGEAFLTAQQPRSPTLRASVVSSHVFSPQPFSGKPTWCCQCEGYMWTRGYRCSTVPCDFVVHKHCKSVAQFYTQCAGVRGPGESPSDEQSPLNKKAIQVLGGEANGSLSRSLHDKYSSVFSAKEFEALYAQYNAMDTERTGRVTCDQLRIGMGTIMSDPVLSTALFRLLDEDRDGHISFAEFVKGMVVLQKGTPQTQLAWGFKLFSPQDLTKQGILSKHAGDSLLVIARADFESILRGVDRSLGAIHFRQIDAMLDAIFEKKDYLTESEYIAAMHLNEQFVRSLGLIGAPDPGDGMPRKRHTSLYRTTSASAVRAARRNISITFGHSSWDLSYHMHFGIRIAVGEVTAAHRRVQRQTMRESDASSWNTPELGCGAEAAPVVDYALSAITAAARAHANARDANSLKDYDAMRDSNVGPSEAQWIFRDYAPDAFHHARSELGIDAKEYMYSLGPEKILGNLLLGSLGALCDMVSTGRSGSFFFKSVDKRYLIKTLPPEEHVLLQDMVLEYCAHVARYKNTLLTRFCGAHAMRKLHDRRVRGDIYFCVMENAFPEWYQNEQESSDDRVISQLTQIHEQYDLKGSTVNRHTVVPEGVPLQEVALKDNDLKRKIKLGPLHKALLMEQIEADSQFLLAHGICDYSFLLGIHFLDEAEQRWVKKNPPHSNRWRESPRRTSPNGPEDRSAFRSDWGGIISSDGTELYFFTIIDVLTTYNYKKAGEHFAKSLLHDSTRISAVKPTPYRTRFQKYVASIVE